MYGDATAIRHLARRLRERADEIRASAARLADQIDRAPWHGLAADAMRQHTQAQLAGLLETARLHDDAADTLDRHAHEVQRLQDLIAAIERKVAHLVDAALDRVASIGKGLLDDITGAVPDPSDVALARFRPPPAGHLDWLRVDLPGL
jgi:uncharacterized protein YukE